MRRGNGTTAPWWLFTVLKEEDESKKYSVIVYVTKKVLLTINLCYLHTNKH